jgi:hypothetical protein
VIDLERRAAGISRPWRASSRKNTRSFQLNMAPVVLNGILDLDGWRRPVELIGRTCMMPESAVPGSGTPARMAVVFRNRTCVFVR